MKAQRKYPHHKKAAKRAAKTKNQKIDVLAREYLEACPGNLAGAANWAHFLLFSALFDALDQNSKQRLLEHAKQGFAWDEPD